MQNFLRFLWHKICSITLVSIITCIYLLNAGIREDADLYTGASGRRNFYAADNLNS